MTDKLFDNFVSNKLKNYNSPVPNGLWEKIIDEEEKRKPVIFWWTNKTFLLIAALMLCATLGTGYYFINLKKNNVNSSLVKLNNDKNATSNNDLETKILLSTKNKITKDITTLNVEKNESDLIETVSKEIINNKKGIINKKGGFSNTLLITSKEKDTKEMKNDEDLYENRVDLSYKILKNITVSSSQNKNRIQLKIKNKSFDDISFTENNIQNLATNFNKSLYNSIGSKPFWASIIMPEYELLNPKKILINKPLDLKQLFNGTDDCPTANGNSRNDLYIEGYASADIAVKKLAENTSGNNNYLSKKDSSETMNIGFTIGGRISKNLSKNLLLKAGLQYSQFNEKFTLRTENERRQTIVINDRIIIRPGQSDTTISDTSISLQIGYRVRSNINRYKNLEIPLMISYEVSKPESSWQLAVNAGAIVNITSWYEGKTIDANYNPVIVASKANNGVYKSQVGVSLYGGICILRKIDNQIAVFAEPYFRYGISNSLQSTTGFTQKFNVLGLQFGARIKINKNKHL